MYNEIIVIFILNWKTRRRTARYCWLVRMLLIFWSKQKRQVYLKLEFSVQQIICCFFLKPFFNIFGVLQNILNQTFLIWQKKLKRCSLFNEPINKQINKFNICVQEIAIENYHEVDVPEHLVQKFEQMDKFYLED